VSSSIPHANALSTGSTEWPQQPPALACQVPLDTTEVQVGSGFGMHDLAGYADYQVPSNAELADMQAESSDDDLGDLGCYDDGPSMQDD
jgi:hypothetical protein